MEEIIASLAQLRDRPAEIRPCYGLPTDPADTCRELVLRDDRHEPCHPKHDPNELDSIGPPLPADMPPGRGFLSNEVAHRRYTDHPQVAQQVAVMRSRQIAAIQASNVPASS